MKTRRWMGAAVVTAMGLAAMGWAAQSRTSNPPPTRQTKEFDAVVVTFSQGTDRTCSQKAQLPPTVTILDKAPKVAFVFANQCDVDVTGITFGNWSPSNPFPKGSSTDTYDVVAGQTAGFMMTISPGQLKDGTYTYKLSWMAGGKPYSMDPGIIIKP